MARALGRLLRDRGVDVVGIASRDPNRAGEAARFIGTETVSYPELVRRAERIIIAVADDAVHCVAQLLGQSGMDRGTVLYTCGSLGTLTIEGVSCGMLHPLQTIASVEQGVGSLPGSTFAISGDAEATAWAGEMVRVLDGRALRIRPGSAAIYHAAAVMASNYVTAMMASAVELMDAAGVGEEEALTALAPLLRTSVENTLTLGPRPALTGPIQRGDAATVARHLAALREASEETQALYRAAGRQALRVAAHPNAEIERLLNG